MKGKFIFYIQDIFLIYDPLHKKFKTIPREKKFFGLKSVGIETPKFSLVAFQLFYL